MYVYIVCIVCMYACKAYKCMHACSNLCFSCLLPLNSLCLQGKLAILGVSVGLFWKEVNWLCAYVPLWKQTWAWGILTHMLLCFFVFHPFSLVPSLHSSFTASQNILFLSMAGCRADKRVEGSGGSDIIGFSCQIGSKSSLWARRRPERGSRFLPDFYRGNDRGPSRPHRQPVIQRMLWWWPTAQVFTVWKIETRWACFII